MDIQIGLETPPLTADASGTIRVGGTRVTLETVIGAYKNGSSAEKILEYFPALTIADIYGAISYYLHHKEAVDAYMADVEAESLRIQEEHENQFNPTGIRERLRVKHEQQDKR